MEFGEMQYVVLNGILPKIKKLMSCEKKPQKQYPSWITCLVFSGEHPPRFVLFTKNLNVVQNSPIICIMPKSFHICFCLYLDGWESRIYRSCLTIGTLIQTWSDGSNAIFAMNNLEQCKQKCVENLECTCINVDRASSYCSFFSGTTSSDPHPYSYEYDTWDRNEKCKVYFVPLYMGENLFDSPHLCPEASKISFSNKLL